MKTQLSQKKKSIKKLNMKMYSVNIKEYSFQKTAIVGKKKT